MDFQQLILGLQQYWSERGCILTQPCDLEVGAGTFNPATFLRCLGPEPWNAAYVEPSRRPADGRYGENPNRLGAYYQFQVILKPAPPDSQDIYLRSLKELGIDLKEHDVRFVEDDWESPTLGATGLGWEVWLDGMEVTQFTYFQRVGGMELDPVCVELTYGLERIAMFTQKTDSVFDLRWAPGITYGEIRRGEEAEYSHYCFEIADAEKHLQWFNDFEKECGRCLKSGAVMPACDYVLKCSHVFNMLEARGAIGVSQRTSYVARVRKLARKVACAYATQREELGHPLLTD